MKPYVHYRDIPKQERVQLAREAYRRSRTLRLIQQVSIGLAVLCSALLTDSFISRDESFFFRLGIHVLGAVVLSSLAWEWLVNWRMKAAVEKLKNT